MLCAMAGRSNDKGMNLYGRSLPSSMPHAAVQRCNGSFLDNYNLGDCTPTHKKIDRACSDFDVDGAP